uniref:Uncharacterized protein n=1 Tax=Proboscia inermis TaxID=420281 RepID=A0A7S0CJI3_9STRA|mmetsp:Transcript_51048/g.51450  ORF Transcript_51048/g.51450 Transcript_51048/m.51450 type:complete len:103 (+) Transcript_51048:516-824(+)
MTQLRRKALTCFTLFLSLWNHVSATMLEHNDTSGSNKNRGQSAIKLSHTKSDSSATNHVRGSFTEAFYSDKRSGYYETVRKVPIHSSNENHGCLSGRNVGLP